ncbi:Phosphatidylserine/phosphatidylglycerophosphate/cardiolipin synthase [Bradyrhizobium lablabi]|uniref:Phospholipase D n=1 Tax=Bradyrhizobium lablabi TaxID=722472 RepID=A0A1M6RUQ8_9BRAD|nr:phospholipase D-like domain-containing protein [Bradyrhizobium lablabi]SHK36213.1 Phosphatidylserine/phosphatidylglycerophosphate/cardiolipin synthase [Bradyrhizobium lablabi]
MRVSQSNDHLRVKAIAGTHVVLMALDMDETERAGLHGFAIKRGQSGQPQTWLRGIKYFKDLVPTPDPRADYSSRDQPFQTFLWSDYGASPGTQYDFTIVALYGDLHAMEGRHTLTFSIKTEQEYDANGQGVWFNRGAIASHAFATKFNNKALTSEMTDNVSDDGKLLDPETQWLSRGLAEACLQYINGAKRGEGLRVCAYEFTYQPILLALKRAHDRGVDVQIVFHDTKKDKDANRAAITKANLPASIVHPRTRTAIPHNKFIVKLVDGKPQQVWTGSTNFTDTGFYGQTNVGQIVANAALANAYLDYWTELKGDPVHSQALKNAIGLTPNPPNAISKSSVVPFFSPRIADNMLDWYGQRIIDTATLAMMTIPFNVATTILAGLGKTGNAMRLVILEDVPTKEVSDAEARNKGKLAFSNGAILGKSFIKYKAGGAKVTPIPNSGLDDWFISEELDRPTNSGHVFFVHAKILLIDPLSDDPLVCSGSANFSTNSLTSNDENMLLIRGDTRVADIYMTELDRIFRHFRARDIINSEAAAGQKEDWLLLDPTDGWIGANFKDGSYKNNRRLLFFPAGTPAKAWSVAAAGDPNPFGDEAARAVKVRADKNAKARARKAGGAGSKSTAAPKKKAAASKKKAAVKKAKTPAKTAKKKKKAAKKNKTSKKTAKKKAGKRTASKKTASKAKKSSTAKKR